MDRLAELQTPLNDRLAENKQAMQGLQSAALAAAARQETEATERHEAFVRDVTTSTKASERALERVQAASAERLDEVQREIASNHRDATESASRNAAALASRTSELEERLQATAERLGVRCQEIEKNSAADRAAIDRKHSTRTTALKKLLNDTAEIANDGKASAEKAHVLLGEKAQELRDRIDSAESALGATTAALQAQSDTKFAATQASIDKLGADVTENLMGQVERLQEAVDADLKPLMVTVKEMGETLATVGEQAATADGTKTKLDLLTMDVESISGAVRAMDELHAPTGEEFAEIESEMAVVKEDVQDLGVELSIVASTVDVVTS